MHFEKDHALEQTLATNWKTKCTNENFDLGSQMWLKKEKDNCCKNKGEDMNKF